jgi:predicted MFS family arabinose efflux permease
MPASHALQRTAARTLFAALGLGIGAWGAQVPALAQRYALNEAQLSMALLAAAVGAVSCLLVAPKLVMRVGPRRCVKGASSIMCLVIAAVLFGEAWWTIGAIMVGFGLSTALFDVSVNAEANRIEQETGWKLMSSVHAMFSLGSMVGALGCAGLLRLGVAPQWQLAGFGLALLPVYLWAAHQLDGPHPDAHADENNSPFTLPTGPLLWMGMVGALGLVAEGALFDWSALYVKQELQGSAAMGALAFAAFSAAMAYGRLRGDSVRARVAPPRLLLVSGVLAAVGMAIALVGGRPEAALVGFVIVGLGLANIVPVMFAAAGQMEGVPPAQGVAAVSAVGYAGFLFGPPMIGGLARGTSLSAALWLVVLFAVLIAALSGRVLKKT